jgi:hypothetical protein
LPSIRWRSSNAGTQLAVLFAGATFVTYLGLFLSWRSESAQVQLGARWPGAAYFLGLAVVELSGFYLRWLPPRAAGIAAAFRNSRRSTRSGR